MKQPQLGKRLNEIRIQKGITQKELSDLCSVDIRTIQRIESGEVEPRMSTLKILSAALENDEILFNPTENAAVNRQLKTTFRLAIIAGMVYFFNFIFYSVIGPNFTTISGGPVLFVLSVLHILSGCIFFYGFVALGRQYQNLFLMVASILIIIQIPLFVVIETLARVTGHVAFLFLIRATVVFIGVTGVFFGTGLIKCGSSGKTLFMIAGIFQIAQNLMFIVPFGQVQYLGLWLAVPANFILWLLLFVEFKEIKNAVS